jgi:hypothetical protein
MYFILVFKDGFDIMMTMFMLLHQVKWWIVQLKNLRLIYFFIVVGIRRKNKHWFSFRTKRLFFFRFVSLPRNISLSFSFLIRVYSAQSSCFVFPYNRCRFTSKHLKLDDCGDGLLFFCHVEHIRLTNFDW